MLELVERPRAARYAMSAPVSYRPVGGEGWCEGRTVNVSCSGVLFQCPTGMAAGTAIEFVLLLPSLGLPGRSRVRCRGRIVRRAGGPEGKACVLAATIDAYDFLAPVPEPAAGNVDV